MYRAFCILFLLVFLTLGNNSPSSSHSASTAASTERLTPNGGYYGFLSYLIPDSVRPGGISVYDVVMRAEAAREGHDWRLLSAIAYVESRFDNSVVSVRGACGIMQIMPKVARQYDVLDSLIVDPTTNIRLAARILSRIEGCMRLPRSMPYEDRMAIVLACYNSGVGHVIDARRLAVKYGGDPDSWDDVSDYLAMQSESQYADDEVVTSGGFDGSSETIAFVNGVMKKYRAYCNRVAM